MKRFIAAILMAASVLTFSGCSEDSKIDFEEAKSEVDRFLEADGREYGKTYTAKVGEKQKNTFFSMVVNSVEYSDEEGGYVAEDGYDFASVNVTVKNITKDTIPMGCYDFYIRWGENDADCDSPAYAEDFAADDLYGYEFNLAAGQEYTATLYFVVPTDKHDKLELVYEEYYDDEFVGSTYIVKLA